MTFSLEKNAIFTVFNEQIISIFSNIGLNIEKILFVFGLSHLVHSLSLLANFSYGWSKLCLHYKIA
jgi:hypothetical protein